MSIIQEINNEKIKDLLQICLSLINDMKIIKDAAESGHHPCCMSCAFQDTMFLLETWARKAAPNHWDIRETAEFSAEDMIDIYNFYNR